MTPEQKLKWAILARAASFKEEAQPPYPCPDVDNLYEQRDEDPEWECSMIDAREEVRTSGTETKIPTEYSRHYESDAVAMEMPDGSWVGWTYWYGGGKHGNPEEMPWMESAYHVHCTSEEKVVTVRTFTN